MAKTQDAVTKANESRAQLIKSRAEVFITDALKSVAPDDISDKAIEAAASEAAEKVHKLSAAVMGMTADQAKAMIVLMENPELF